MRRFLAAAVLPDPKPAPPPVLPHFRCYQVLDGPAPGQTVDLSDQFNTVKNLGVRNPKFICAPVEKAVVKGAQFKTKGPLDHLVCYEVTGPPAKADATIDNQLQGQFFRIGQGELLCVPTT